MLRHLIRNIVKSLIFLGAMDVALGGGATGAFTTSTPLWNTLHQVIEFDTKSQVSPSVTPALVSLKLKAGLMYARKDIQFIDRTLEMDVAWLIATIKYIGIDLFER